MALRSSDDARPWSDFWVCCRYPASLGLHLTFPSNHEGDDLLGPESPHSSIPRASLQLRQRWALPHIRLTSWTLHGSAKWGWDACHESHVTWARPRQYRWSWISCLDWLDYASLPLNGSLAGSCRQNRRLGTQDGKYHSHCWERIRRTPQRHCNGIMIRD